MTHDQPPEQYLPEGLKILANSGLQSNTQLRVGVSLLMRAISYDLKMGNHKRAKIIRDMIVPLIKLIKNEAEDRWISGLSSEWLGDVYMMTDRESKAADFFRDAKEEYITAKRSDQQFELKQDSWSEEEEFFYAYIAFVDFIEECYGLERDMVEGEASKKEFESRIDSKLDLLNCSNTRTK